MWGPCGHSLIRLLSHTSWKRVNLCFAFIFLINLTLWISQRTLAKKWELSRESSQWTVQIWCVLQINGPNLFSQHCMPGTSESGLYYNTEFLSVQISGLLLEGCSFDGSRLSENQHDSPSVSSVLPCYMGWTPQVSLGCTAPISLLHSHIYFSARYHGLWWF